jgi:drug/metabolite transporter (DMT)-like permease
MQFSAPPAWAWIPIVIAAAAFQTVRNAAQRSLVADLGTLSATLVRFLYGLPFAALWLLAVVQFLPAGGTAQSFSGVYFLWLATGAVAQILATAFLLLAMAQRNFVIGVALAKTEVLQAGMLGSLLLLEIPGLWSALAMLCASVGVVMLSLPKPAAGGPAVGATWFGKAALAGLVSGACFALASVGYRGAALTQPGVSPWLVGASGVLLAQMFQTVLLGGWIFAREPRRIAQVVRAWRMSTVAGAMGALASIGWFTGFALRPVADIKTLGLIEVLFSYAVSRKLFDENLSRNERWGLVLVTLGLVVICAQL